MRPATIDHLPALTGAPTLAAIVLALALAASLWLAGCAPAAAALPTAAAPPRPTLIAPSLTEIGLQIVPISSLPAAAFQQLRQAAVPERVAVANARANAGGVDWNQPYSVDALLALYTNFQRGTHDQFVWLVAYHGVIYLPGGLTPETNTELNVLLDARTGQYLEAFSYR